MDPGRAEMFGFKKKKKQPTRGNLYTLTQAAGVTADAAFRS